MYHFLLINFQNRDRIDHAANDNFRPHVISARGNIGTESDPENGIILNNAKRKLLKHMESLHHVSDIYQRIMFSNLRYLNMILEDITILIYTFR